MVGRGAGGGGEGTVIVFLLNGVEGGLIMEDVELENKAIRISGKKLAILAYCYMILPIIIFFIGWLKIGIGITLSAVLLFGLYHFIKRRYEKDEYFFIEAKSISIMLALVCLWVFLSGVGGYFCQRSDLHWRNAVFRDLIDYSWPVIYPETGNALVYYYIYWMLPALVGKVLGWATANLFLFLWTVMGIFISMLLLCKTLKVYSTKKVLTICVIYVFWSGLNIIGMTYMAMRGYGSGGILGGGFGWPDYVSGIQYTPNNALLEWVFNQTIVPWVAVSLFLHDKRIDNLAYLGLCMLAFAPLPFVGFFVIALAWASTQMIPLVKRKEYTYLLKTIFSVPNISAVLSIFTVFLLFFTCNTAVNGSAGVGGIGLYIEPEKFTGEHLKTLLLFYCIEFLCYSFLCYKEYKKDVIFYVINISLLIFPLIRVGTGRDFCMRASIPALFILMVMVMNKICAMQQEILSLRSALLIAVISVSSLSAVGDWAWSFSQIKNSGVYPIWADDIVTLSNKNLEDAAGINFLVQAPDKYIFFKYLTKEKSQKAYDIDFSISKEFRQQHGLSLGAGRYDILPKLDHSLELVADDMKILLGNDNKSSVVSALNEGKYKIFFNEYQVALDVPDGLIDDYGSASGGTPWDTESQKWILEELEGFYMICFQDYALTYDLNTGTVNMTLKTGADNQLWSFISEADK